MEICEMRRTSWILVTLLCLPSILSSTGFQHGHAEDPLDKRIDSLQLQNETILDALARMNAATELSVSFEAILKESLSSQDVGYPRFTTRIEGGSVREILDRICVLDGRFTWSRYKNT